MEIPDQPQAPLTIGISRCLLGREVRYDGTGARSSLPHDSLDGLFEFRDICPEVGIGMTVPREPIRLQDAGSGVRVVGVKDASVDVTEALYDFGQRHAARSADLAGFIFMHNSPSCGVHRVKVYPGHAAPAERKGRGMFAQAMTDALPVMPVEDAGRLFDDVLRENFVTRAFAYAHWQALLAEQPLTAGRLIEFHSRYKYLLMAHDVGAYKQCGQLLSNLKGNLEQTAAAYIAALMGGLTQAATRKGHANVLSHLQGYLKKHLDSDSRQELSGLIDAYRMGQQPLLAVIGLLKHHFRRHEDAYVEMQIYLHPHPEQAALRRSL